MDKVAFITGANRGLGRSTAHHLSRAGIGVVGTYFTNESEAAEVAKQISEAGGCIAMLQLDLGDTSTFATFKEKLVKTLQENFSRNDLDFVVQNAGNAVLGKFEDVTGEGLDSLYRVHFKGPYLLNQMLVPMIKRGGRIINFSTAATRFCLKDHGPYSAIKAATEVITRYMAHELGERQIRVNVVAPAAIETDFANGEVRGNKELNQMFAAATPLGRVGLPDDIGGAINALLADDIGWLNGQRIELSGGQSL